MSAKIFSNELIRRCGLDQRSLANKIGGHRTRMSQFANGRAMPTLPTARKIAEALSLPLDDLVFPAEAKERALSPGLARKNQAVNKP